MEERKGTSVALLMLYGLLITALLVLAVTGAKLYGAIGRAAQTRADIRSALAYIQSQTAGCEGTGGAYLTAGPEGTMLCLPEPEGDYETRIYLYQGFLRSELSALDEEARPEEAEVICPLSEFSIGWQAENLLVFTADGKTAWAAVGGGDGRG